MYVGTSGGGYCVSSRPNAFVVEAQSDRRVGVEYLFLVLESCMAVITCVGVVCSYRYVRGIGVVHGFFNGSNSHTQLQHGGRIALLQRTKTSPSA